MKAHSEKDPQCVPNVITYSALMTACCSGGRPDKAHEVFQDMVASGIKPDQISYSTLIAGEQGSLERKSDKPLKLATHPGRLKCDCYFPPQPLTVRQACCERSFGESIEPCTGLEGSTDPCESLSYWRR